jgi:hypothetical protein
MPTLRISRLRVPLLLVCLASCSCQRPDRESFDKFGSAYVAFRKAARDSAIVSWVIVLDQSERTDGSNGTYYRRYFAGALDVTASNRSRAASAKQAVAYYEDNSTKAMDDFEARNDATHDKFLALVESANSVRGESRRQTTAITESARKIDDDFAAMRKSYVGLYDLQVDLLKRIDEEGGDLSRALPVMQAKALEKKKLENESSRLSDEEQADLRKLQEEYAAFKGLTGTRSTIRNRPMRKQIRYLLSSYSADWNFPDYLRVVIICHTMKVCL